MESIRKDTCDGSVNSRFRCKSTENHSSILRKLKTKDMKVIGLKLKPQASFRDFLGNIHDQEEEVQVSDSESSSTTGSPKGGAIGLFHDIGLVKLDEEENGHQLIKRAFLGGMGELGRHTHVVAVHRNSFAGLAEQARLQTFRVFSEMMAKKRRSHGGNIKFGWYGTTKEGVNSIIDHGFSHGGKMENNGMHGNGIYLSPHSSSLDSAMSASVDEDGLRHVLLCRVVLGNMEEIPFGSQQTHPSAKVYDSGVDNILSPKKYIVWSANMNTHILPEYVISFRAPPSLNSTQETVAPPKSPWIGLGSLISVLSRFLPPDTVTLIKKYHFEFHERKLSRHEMIQHVRQAVGDKLLISVIKSVKSQQNKSSDSLPTIFGG